jgi:hypothetical protein
MGELGLAVVGEDAPVTPEVARRDALEVLVEEAGQVDLQMARPERGAFVLGQLLQEALVEPPCQLDVGVRAAVSVGQQPASPTMILRLGTPAFFSALTSAS